MKTLAVGILFLAATLPSMAQTNREPYTFFKEHIGLKDEQVKAIEDGKAVTKDLSTSTPAEIAIFGAIFVNGTPEDFIKAARNVGDLRKSSNYLGVRQFSSPPTLSDLEGFVVDEQDIKDLKDCKPGHCEVQMPTESMEEFKKSVNWSGADVQGQVNRLAQKMALEELVRYQKDGNSALGDYYDKEHPLHVTEQFEALLGESESLSRYLPELKRYLIEYPHSELAKAENIFYWEKVKFGLKPTLRMNQMVILRGTGSPGTLDAVAIKQLYSSHYFQTAVDLTVCARDSSRPDKNGFYLITVKGSRQAGLTGPKGSIIRKNAVSRTRSSLEASLAHMKTVLESKH